MAFRRKTIECKEIGNAQEAVALAERFHEMGGTRYERELQNHRTERIKAKTLTGEHVTFNLAFGVVAEDGLRCRVDGQHTTEFFLKMTEAEWKQVRFPLDIVVTEYECDTAVDLAGLFEQFNPSWSSRTPEDLVGCHLAVHPDLIEAVPRKIARLLTTGLAWYLHRVRKVAITAETKYELIHADPDHREFLVWGGSFLREGKVEDTTRQPVVAAMFHTTRSGDEVTRAFWKKVAAGTGQIDPIKEPIEYKLAEFLELVRLTRNCRKRVHWPEAVAKYLDEGANPRDIDIFNTCLRAADAHRRGRRIAEVFVQAKTKDAAVLVQEMLPALVG